MRNRNVGIAISFIDKIINMLCGLFLSSFLLRSLGDTEYGVYKTISSFVNYLVLLEFGTGTVMTRNISLCKGKGASKEEINKNISTIWSITCILSIIILLISVVFFFSIDGIYSNTLTPDQIGYSKYIFIFVVIYLVASFFSQTLDGVTLACEKYAFASILSIARNLVRVSLLVGLIFAWKYSIVIAIVDAGISVILAILKYFYCKKKLKVEFKFKYFDKLIFKSILPLCAALFLQTLVTQANNNVDQFIIGIKIDPETVSLYSVALYIYSIFNSLMMIPVNMYVPQITQKVAEGKRGDELVAVLVKPNRLVAIIGGFILFGFLSVGKQFVSIVYGSEYLKAWVIAVILMTPTYISMTNSASVNVLNALNKRLARSLIIAGTTVFNIVLTLIWIDKYGIIGASLATAISTIIGPVILANIHYLKAIKLNVFKVYWGSYKGILLNFIVATISTILVCELISNVYLSFLFGGLFFVALFLGMFLLWGASKEEKKTIKNIFNRITSKLGRKR